MLVPTDLPQRADAAGLPVHVLDGWETNGSSADHGAVVFHWTASGRNESPSSCANYCAWAATDAPLYNVLVDRDGGVWFLAREKSNNAGKISGVALNETLSGHANVDSASSRGLPDTTSANDRLFAISAQNDGVGEPWSEALINSMSVMCALALETLGLNDVGYLGHHQSLTARKVDLTPRYGCPPRQEWYARIDAALGGDMPLSAQDLDAITARVRDTVLDIVRKEGISGAASGFGGGDYPSTPVADTVIAEVRKVPGWVAEEQQGR